MFQSCKPLISLDNRDKANRPYKPSKQIDNHNNQFKEFMDFNKTSSVASRNDTTYLVKENMNMNTIEDKINRLMAVKDKFMKKNKTHKESSSSTSTVSGSSSDEYENELNLSTCSTPVKGSDLKEKGSIKKSKSKSDLENVKGILKPVGNRTIGDNSSIRQVEASTLTAENTIKNSRVFY